MLLSTDFEVAYFQMLVSCLHYDVVLSFLISVLNHVLSFPSASIYLVLIPLQLFFVNTIVNFNMGAPMTSLY